MAPDGFLHPGIRGQQLRRDLALLVQPVQELALPELLAVRRYLRISIAIGKFTGRRRYFWIGSPSV